MKRGTTGALKWVLMSDYQLIISGNGPMPDYIFTQGENPAPWSEYRDRLDGVIVEQGVKSIGKDAFRACEFVEEASLPAGLLSICNGAFYYCPKLEEIVVPASVKTIGNEAFAGCHSLKEVRFSGLYDLTSIGKRAFWQCRTLEKIEIPGRVTEIGTGAFRECSKLKNVYIKASKPPKLGIDNFAEVKDDILHVPKVSLDKYKEVIVWKQAFANIVEQ